MTTSLSQFQLDHLYSNEEIHTSLGVGNAGGIRPNLLPDGSIRRLVLMTALPTARQTRENPYHDRTEGSILTYTGKGLRGDQEHGGLNQRLAEQRDRPFPIWCFQQIASRRDKHAGQKRWKFLGLLTLQRYHRETQIDTQGALRSVWLFEFEICSQPPIVTVETENALAQELWERAATAKAHDPTDQVIEDAEASETGLADVGIERVRSWLLSQHPSEFEHTVKKALDATGYRDVSVTRYSQDGGIDVVAGFGAFGWPVHRWRVQVQAKRWRHTVGRKEVAELRGSLQPFGLGCLITTSHFSKAAVTESQEGGKSPITLVNGWEFAKLLRDCSVGP